MDYAAIAKRAGMALPQLSDYARGRRNPTLRTLTAIAQALDIEAWELLRGPLPGQGLPTRAEAIEENIRWFQGLGPSQKLRAAQAQARARTRLSRLKGSR